MNIEDILANQDLREELVTDLNHLSYQVLHYIITQNTDMMLNSYLGDNDLNNFIINQKQVIADKYGLTVPVLDTVAGCLYAKTKK